MSRNAGTARSAGPNRNAPFGGVAADSVDVAIVVECPDWEHIADLQQAIGDAATGAVLAGLGQAPRAGRRSVVVALLADADVRALNLQFRGKDMATNVLSFPSARRPGQPAADVDALGDIALAYETMAGEAWDRGITLLDHVRHLVVHGVLHLLGYDHETEAEAVSMETLETQILARIGVADPYAS